jgi:hypothetical protein
MKADINNKTQVFLNRTQRRTMALLLSLSLSTSLPVIADTHSPVPFVPFKLADLNRPDVQGTHAPYEPTDRLRIVLPDETGKEKEYFSGTAAQWVDQLNSMEKVYNSKGLSLRDSLNRSVISENLTEKNSELANQIAQNSGITSYGVATHLGTNEAKIKSSISPCPSIHEDLLGPHS